MKCKGCKSDFESDDKWQDLCPMCREYYASQYEKAKAVGSCPKCHGSHSNFHWDEKERFVCVNCYYIAVTK